MKIKVNKIKYVIKVILCTVEWSLTFSYQQSNFTDIVGEVTFAFSVSQNIFHEVACKCEKIKSWIHFSWLTT